MHGYKRSARVGELIQRELSRIVQECRTPGLGFVTLTGLKLTDDLQTARVFYSVLGTPEETKASAALLSGLVPEFRHELAVRLNLRRTPTIEFVFDETPARADRVFSLLQKIKDEDPAPDEDR